MHPVVLMSILDHHIRREAVGDKVIGALLGTVGPGGVVEVTNAFGIFHKATQEEILVRRQTLNDLLELHRRVDPNETLVGWYSSWRGSGAEAASAPQAAAAPYAAGGAARAGSSAADAAAGGAGAGPSAGAADYIDQVRPRSVRAMRVLPLCLARNHSPPPPHPLFFLALSLSLLD